LDRSSLAIFCCYRLDFHYNDPGPQRPGGRLVIADMRYRLTAIVVACGVLPGAPAWSQTQQQIDWCVNTGNAYPPDVRIVGCTAAIESGQWSGGDIVWAFMNRGLALATKRDLRAIADFDEVIRIEPRQVRALFERGRIFAATGNVARAIRDLDQALAANPNYTDARIYRAGIRRRSGDYDGAIRDFSAALAVDDDARIHVARGGAYRAKGDYEHAAADYEEALTLVPGRAAFLDSRGQANFSMARYDAAAADFTSVLDFDPGSAATALWLFLSRARAGDQAAAAADLAARAPKLRRPEWPYPAVELFLGRGTPEAALAAATRPDEHCEARIFVGEWHLLRGDTAAAIGLLKSMEDDCPKFFIDHHELAETELKRLGQ
jgi:tetratricopeptide (TPR) repeat protein